jgi:hypothetical protein
MVHNLQLEYSHVLATYARTVYLNVQECNNYIASRVANKSFYVQV